MKWTIFRRLYWICYNTASASCFVFWLSGTRDLSFLTRYGTSAQALEGEVLTTWTTREVPKIFLNLVFKNFNILTCFLDSSVGKEFAYNAGGLGSILGLGRSPGEGKASTPVFWPGEFHGVHGVAKSRTQLSNFHFHFFSILITCTLLLGSWWEKSQLHPDGRLSVRTVLSGRCEG